MIARFAVLCALSALNGVWLAKKLSITGVIVTVILVIVLILQLKRNSFSIILFLPLFFFYSDLYDNWNTSKLNPNQTDFRGIIQSIPDIDGKILSFHFEILGENTLVRYKLNSESEKKSFIKNLKFNMICTMTGTLTEPKPKSGFYGMDYPAYLHRQKIYWTLEPSVFKIQNCKTRSNHDFVSSIKTWRSNGIKKLEKSFSPNTAGLMNALIFGYRKGIETETLESYQRLGLTHLLAVSGFNVGIVSYFLYLIFVRIGIIKEAAHFLIIGLLPVYVIITGGESSIVRAGIMGILFYLFIIFGKKLDPAIILSFVCIVMLLFDPSLAFDLGFQLSFLMTFILITSISFLTSNSFLVLLFTTSCMCSFFSFPIIIYNFYEFSLWSIPLNILYIPLVSFVLFPVSVLVFLLVVLLPGPIGLITYPVEFLFEHTASFLNLFQGIFGSVLFGKPSLYIVVLYFAALIYLFYKWEKEQFHIKFTLPFIIVLILQTILPYLNPAASVSFINVGQGDSILIELPFRKGVYLIDTGGTISFEREEWEKPKEEFDVTKKIVIPYLKARGIKKLDGLILSHGDMDHAGGAPLLLGKVPIDYVLMPNNIPNELEIQIQAKAKREGIKVQYLNSGVHWERNGTKFYVMHPSYRELSSNNQSVILWTQIYRTTLLFTGDIEKEGEKELLLKYGSVQADVLKVAHHGSKTSSTATFIEKVSPKYGVVSVGENNIYGHPNDEVLQRLKLKKVKLYRTDQNGDILFTINKNGLDVFTAK
ncbi:DNA internalization-related competence protein ComEC/Rec2 [Bacillus sp. NEB1478]|uniref:DNA internalization-related competence protein ComEC/Rec2 n=1 Tax=Bacillus sp. NEB1478 TaxID=3073816 RepID=UPI00287316E5|nr:DNA internalization-related competence protein ComEC/Rec2 [Bacillus sp. NEB1478]WNB93463.1 DNA internalization-related competence protein ComEC/Rec2 [Bacillus sp. NEB1478]